MTFNDLSFANAMTLYHAVVAPSLPSIYASFIATNQQLNVLIAFNRLPNTISFVVYITSLATLLSDIGGPFLPHELSGTR